MRRESLQVPIIQGELMEDSGVSLLGSARPAGAWGSAPRRSLQAQESFSQHMRVLGLLGDSTELLCCGFTQAGGSHPSVLISVSSDQK